MSSDSLRELFYNHQGKLIHKWDHYFEVYEKHFSKYIGQELNILEIGISHGGSLQLWKKFFGDKVNVYAIDINPECKKLEEERVKIFIGSQSDTKFLREVLNELPDLDIVLDDGGHTMMQQIVSFESLYLKVKEGGLYVVEDTHTSYWHEFHGGIKKRGSFIEYSKNLIDSIYDGHIADKSKIIVNEITQHINCISFYDSIVVFEKQKRKAPFHIRRGNETIKSYDQQGELKKPTILMQLKAKIFGKIDTFSSNDKGKV